MSDPKQNQPEPVPPEVDAPELVITMEGFNIMDSQQPKSEGDND